DDRQPEQRRRHGDSVDNDETDEDRKRQQEVNEVRPDGDVRQQRRRERRLPDEVAIRENRHRRLEHRRLEPVPGRDPDEDVRRVILSRDLEEDAKHEVVHDHLRRGIHERPRDAEVRSLVAKLHVADEKLSQEITFPKEVELSQIAVDSTANTIELGNRVTFTATAKDKKGKVVDVPVTWRTSNEKVAVFERDGVLYAKDTGQVFVAAASLGVGSPTVSIQIVWLGPAHVVSGAWSKPVAVNPGAIISDSLRVVVTNSRGQPVTNAGVSFTVTQGGGTVSPILATTNNAGVAAAQWTLGPASGT